ncbi:L-arabinose 1-dehydrogenase (NAD(P)(+)) [uncultured archaeon]|nr:L-arabinose 1-dehydrogenase (NAD(P)(+)) [uncultured archaeon]
MEKTCFWTLCLWQREEGIEMRIAVTGSEGMIGSALAKKLRQQGNEVIECTRKSCNILEQEKIKSAFMGCGVVIHLAAQLDEQAPELWEVNVKGTENVLEACAENQIEQLIFLSSVGVYGAQKGLKTEETATQPETIYEKSKLEAEKKVLSFQEVFHVTILRPAIVLGNNTYWRQIIKAIGKGYPLIGNGKNHWQTVSVEDVVSAIAFCIGKEECYGETFIAAEKAAITLEELVALVRKEAGISKPVQKIPFFLGYLAAHFNALIKFVPMLTPPYVKRMQADRWYSTAKLEALGWKAKDSSREILPKIAAMVFSEKGKTTGQKMERGGNENPKAIGKQCQK